LHEDSSLHDESPSCTMNHSASLMNSGPVPVHTLTVYYNPERYRGTAYKHLRFLAIDPLKKNTKMRTCRFLRGIKMKRKVTRFLILVVLLAGTVFALPNRKISSCCSECCYECRAIRMDCSIACGVNQECKAGCWDSYLICLDSCGTC